MRGAALFLIAAALVAQDLPIEEKQEMRKTFTAKRLDLDNVNGYIHVSGYDGREIQAVIHETVRGETKERVAEARNEVKLNITQPGETVRIQAEGPCCCRCGDGNGNNRRRYGYKVTYDFDIQAPRETTVLLRTVNDGDIKVENISGDYDLDNINGGIEMSEAAGSGRVYALNGKVKVTFRANPQSASTFGSLNGQVELYFQPNLSADLRMKTFNGRFFTDFNTTTLAARAPVPERRNGKQVYRADKYTSVRVGAGGPEIKLDGFNGDIRILKRGN